MTVQHILFIGAGTILQKNDYKAYHAKNLYLNYGLLGLASNLSKQGYAAQMTAWRIS